MQSIRTGLRHDAPCPPSETALDARTGNALAHLLPLLACGEEAAALAFDRLAATAHDSLSRYALESIAREEERHCEWVGQIMQALPHVPRDPGIYRAARHFHYELGRGGSAERLARVAAVDAGACIVFSRLLAPGAPLSQAGWIARRIARIHHDEARHVSAARRLATAGLPAAELRNHAAQARAGLADLLALRADAFEVLAVDPDHLLRDVQALPDGLFPG